MNRKLDPVCSWQNVGCTVGRMSVSLCGGQGLESVNYADCGGKTLFLWREVLTALSVEHNQGQTQHCQFGGFPCGIRWVQSQHV